MIGKLTEFISTTGGPFLLLPENLLVCWDGVFPPKNGRKVEAKFRWNGQEEATDYDRACDVPGYVGVIPVGAGEGLVLGDDPAGTAWFEITLNSGIFVRWIYAESNDAVKETLTRLPEDLAWGEEGYITFKTSPLILFDATEKGTELFDPIIKIDLPCGQYSIKTVAFKPDTHTSLVMHHLEPKV